MLKMHGKLRRRRKSRKGVGEESWRRPGGGWCEAKSEREVEGKEARNRGKGKQIGAELQIYASIARIKGRPITFSTVESSYMAFILR